MKSIILIGGEKDRETIMVKDFANHFEYARLPQSASLSASLFQNPDYELITYRATDIYFGTSQVFLLDGDSQHDFLMRAATHYINNGGV